MSNAPGENFENSDLPKSKVETHEVEKISPEEMRAKMDQMRQNEDRITNQERAHLDQELADSLEADEKRPKLEKLQSLVRNENRIPETAEFFEDPESEKLIVDMNLPQEEWSEETVGCLGIYEADKHGKLHPVEDPYLYVDGDDALLNEIHGDVLA